jgi:DNA-binding transcriptional LysR family regulator
MQLQQLIYFVEVSDKGSINKAAESLIVTQPNLSKAIANLESELNIKIFNRNNKGVSLTEEGKKLYKYSKTILNQVDIIERISKTEPPKILSVSSYPILTSSRLLSDFYNQNKMKNIELRLLEFRIEKIIENVYDLTSEIGIVLINNAQSKEFKHMLDYKNLEFNEISTDTWYVNVGERSPLYTKEVVNMKELLDYVVVRLPDDYFSNLTCYLEIDSISLTNFKKAIYLNNSGAIINFLNKTDAFRFGPGWSKQDFEELGIRTIPIENCDVTVTLGWIKRKKEELSQEALEFVGLLDSFYKY